MVTAAPRHRPFIERRVLRLGQEGCRHRSPRAGRDRRRTRSAGSADRKPAQRQAEDGRWVYRQPRQQVEQARPCPCDIARARPAAASPGRLTPGAAAAKGTRLASCVLRGVVAGDGVDRPVGDAGDDGPAVVVGGAAAATAWRSCDNRRYRPRSARNKAGRRRRSPAGPTALAWRIKLDAFRGR